MFNRIMKKYHEGEALPTGMYLNRKGWDLVHIEEEGERVPEGEGAVYFGLPILLLMVVGPVVGLAFVLFLPVAVPVVMLYAGGKAAYRGVARRMARSAEAEAKLAH